MKRSVCVAALVIVLCFIHVIVTSARHVTRIPTHYNHKHDSWSHVKSRTELAESSSYLRRKMPMMKRKGPDTLQIAGSSLPDCSHACGSCVPCRLVMVSFVCASLEEAETCPMAYKCMCNNKSYPVP